MKPYRQIAITPEQIDFREPQMILKILESGWDMVHIRHPKASLREVRDVIEHIPPRWHRSLRLHGHFELTNEFNLGGLHLNNRCPAPPANYNGPVSRSCHSIQEIIQSPDCDYVTLSPIFDSVSKSGYRAAFTHSDLLELDKIRSPRVIALGGITPERVAMLQPYNFAGYAVLGGINLFFKN